MIPIITYFGFQIGLSLILTNVLGLNVLGIWISNVSTETFSIIFILLLMLCYHIEGRFNEICLEHEHETCNALENNELYGDEDKKDKNDKKDEPNKNSSSKKIEEKIL